MPTTSSAIPLSAFRDELLQAGVLLPTGVAGVYGRSAAFEDTVERIDRLVTAYGADDSPEVMRFPPILNRSDFERSGYLQSFPHLAGTIHSFAGTEPAHRGMLDTIADGGDWSAAFAATRLVLTPAACYPVYPMLAGSLPGSGRLVDVMSYCFRHEPSEDAGTNADVPDARARAGRRSGNSHGVARVVGGARRVLHRRARPRRGTPTSASDPFFGRGGKLLAVNQSDQRLKLRDLRSHRERRQPTAIISLNYHQDHFGEAFAITTAAARSRIRRASASAWSGSRWRSFAGTASTGEHWPRAVRKNAGPVMRELWRLDPAAYSASPASPRRARLAAVELLCGLWIELLHTCGVEPLAAMPFTLTVDLEGDQWTFFKFPLADLDALYGIEVFELNIWDSLLGHVRQQLSLRRPCHRRGRRVPFARYRRHVVSRRSRQDVNRHPGDGRGRRAARVFSQRRLLRAGPA